MITIFLSLIISWGITQIHTCLKQKKLWLGSPHQTYCPNQSFLVDIVCWISLWFFYLPHSRVPERGSGRSPYSSVHHSIQPDSARGERSHRLVTISQASKNYTLFSFFSSGLNQKWIPLWKNITPKQFDLCKLLIYKLNIHKNQAASSKIYPNSVRVNFCRQGYKKYLLIVVFYVLSTCFITSKTF